MEPGDGGTGTAKSAQESASRPDALVGRRAKATSGSGRNVRAAGDAGIDGVRVGVLAPATALCECCTRFKDAGGPTLLMLRCGAGEASARTRGGCRRGGGAMWSLRRLRRLRTPRTMTKARWAMREGVDDARWRWQERLRCQRRGDATAAGDSWRVGAAEAASWLVLETPPLMKRRCGPRARRKEDQGTHPVMREEKRPRSRPGGVGLGSC